MSQASSQATMSRRAFLRVAGVSAAGVALAACTAPAAPAAESGAAGAAAPAPAATTSVRLQHASWAGPMGNQIHYTQRIFMDRLFDQLADGSWQPTLAESWEWAPDATAITFKLRQGVTFHDGQPFTAKDVVASIKAIVSPHLGGRFVRLQPIKGIDAYANDEAAEIEGLKIMDDHTITFEFERPAAGFFAYSAFGRDGVNMLPAHIWEPAIEQARNGEISLKESQNPWYWSPEACVGTGSFRYAEGEPEKFIRLERFDEGWRGKPNLDEIIFQNFGETDTQFLSFQKGELDALVIQPDYFEQVSTMADITVDEFATPYIQALTVSCRDNELGLTDPRVRQALSSAINREAINKGLYHEYNEPWTAVLQGEWYDANAPQFPYDPEKAKALLQEAGFDMNREVVLGFDYPDNLPRQLMEAIQANLQEVGINATLLHVRDAAAEEAVSNGRYTVWLDAYAAHYSPYVLANVHRTEQQAMRGQCGSPALDALFDKAETIADPQGQKAIWSEIETAVQEEASVIPLWRRGAKVAYSNRLQGWDQNTTASFAMFGFHAFGAEKWTT